MSRLEAADARVLSNLNEIARVHGAPVLAELPELFSHANRLFLTFEELDHYWPRPDVQYFGPIWDDDDEADSAEWPCPGQPGVLIYLRAKVPGTADLLRALIKQGKPGMAYVPDAPDSWLIDYQDTPIRISRQPFPLSRLLPQANGVVCRGGIGTVSRALHHDLPLLLLPSTIEEFMSARNIVRLGAGLLFKDHRNEFANELLAGKPPMPEAFDPFRKYLQEESLAQICSKLYADCCVECAINCQHKNAMYFDASG